MMVLRHWSFTLIFFILMVDYLPFKDLKREEDERKKRKFSERGKDYPSCDVRIVTKEVSQAKRLKTVH